MRLFCSAKKRTYGLQRRFETKGTGSVIVLDNASFGKSPQTRHSVEQAGCQLLYLALFLASYSPDLNPIKKLWANLKRHWRKIGGSLEKSIALSNY